MMLNCNRISLLTRTTCTNLMRSTHIRYLNVMLSTKRYNIFKQIIPTSPCFECEINSKHKSQSSCLFKVCIFLNERSSWRNSFYSHPININWRLCSFITVEVTENTRGRKQWEWFLVLLTPADCPKLMLSLTTVSHCSQ